MSSPAPVALSHLLHHAAEALLAVQSGRSLTEVLAALPTTLRPGVQALAFAALRRLGGARAVRAAMAPKPPPREVDALLLVALALLWPSAAGQRAMYPDHTLVDQAVQAAHRRTPAATGFVNALLRRFVRERDTLVVAAERSPEGAFNHPLWWIERVRRDWPAHWDALLRQANERPPMTLRVNARRCDAAQYLLQLTARGLAGNASGTHTVVLAEPCPVSELPGFAEGLVSVQDAAAQRAAPLLLGDGLRPGARVLDACAAPGGKTAHLLELADVDLLALDADAQRLRKVDETLHRLRLSAALRAADARRPADWWDGRTFDAILLDAPCSASGIVRRHPDIRWLRRPADIDALARVQAELLDALWPLLAPGGRLLFTTCSIFRAEGQQQIDAFLQRKPPSDARLDPASPGHLLPLPDNAPAGLAVPSADGFFYALLHKDPPLH